MYNMSWAVANSAASMCGEPRPAWQSRQLSIDIYMLLPADAFLDYYIRCRQ